MCNTDYVFRKAPEEFDRWSIRQRKRFSLDLAGGQLKKHVSLDSRTHFLTTINGFLTLPSYKYHPSSPPILRPSSPLQRCVFIVGLS